MSKSKSTARRSHKRSEEERDLALWDQFAASPAQISGHDVDTIERGAQGADGVRRRVMLATLAFSGAELVEKFGAGATREAADAAAWSISEIEQFRDRLDSLRDLAETAAVRLRLALAEREDMADVLSAERKERAAA